MTTSDATPKAKSVPLPSPVQYCRIAHTPKKAESKVETVINTRWNALRDMPNMDQTGRVHRPDRKIHQARKEKYRCGQNAVDHLFLRNKMHEVAGDQERFDRSDEQCHRDGQCHARQVQVISADGKDCAGKQASKNREIPSDFLLNVMSVMITHKLKN